MPRRQDWPVDRNFDKRSPVGAAVFFARLALRRPQPERQVMATISPESPAEKLLLSPREAAHALGLSERTLWGLSSPRGPIPAVRVGRAVRYSYAALQAWVEAQQPPQA